MSYDNTTMISNIKFINLLLWFSAGKMFILDDLLEILNTQNGRDNNPVKWRRYYDSKENNYKLLR